MAPEVIMGNSSSSSGSGGSVSDHISHASKTGVCALQSKGLTQVREWQDLMINLFFLYQLPDRIQSLCPTLRTLDVSDNKLTSVPPWIGNFRILKSLNISRNNLSKLHVQRRHQLSMCTLLLLKILKFNV